MQMMVEMDSVTLEQAKAYLKRSAGGRSLYEHLTRLVANLVIEKPEHAYDDFEQLSRCLKDAADTSLCPGSSGKTKDLQNDKRSHFFRKQHEKWIEAVGASVSTVSLARMDSKDPEIQNNTVTDKLDCTITDFESQSRLLGISGFGFSSKEIYPIVFALNRLAHQVVGLRTLRFWGKILGTKGDYWIAEGQVEGEEVIPNDETEEPSEPRGVGANKSTYWVTGDILEDWTMLPDLSPAMARAARTTRRMFTGNLDSEIITFPRFPGNERHLLRAVVALISAETLIRPINFSDDENNDDAEYEQQRRASDSPDLEALESWKYERPQILNSGLSAEFVTGKDEDEGGGNSSPASLGRGDTVEDLESQMRVLSQDEKLPSGLDPWQLSNAPVANSARTYIATVALNRWWPGAITVFHNGSKGQLVSVYAGYGVKVGKPFACLLPPDLEGEPVDMEEQPEPQPGDDHDLSDNASVDEIDEDEEEEEEAE